MYKRVFVGLVLALFAISISYPIIASAARLELPVVVIDLAHGERSSGVCAMMKVVSEVYWVVIVKDEAALEALDDCIKNNAYQIIVGDLAKIADLPSVDMIIIGQPMEYLSDAEKEAILNWLNSKGHKALWCAADSDYPAQGGNLETAQHVCNDLLDYLQMNGVDVKLRSDYVSIEDTKSNAAKPYRVVALVKPPARYDADVLAIGAEKVLMHGPGAVAWVDENGDWHKVTDPGTPENIIPILVTTENGRVVEHQPRNPGEPGELGYAHSVGETGSFVLMAAQVLETDAGRIVFIVSGESPYYGYQSLITYQYYNVPLDGPWFFRNLILWAVNMYGELKALKNIMKTASEAVAKAAEAKESADLAISKVEQAASKAEEATSKADQALAAAEEAKAIRGDVEQLSGRVSSVENSLKDLSEKISTLEGKVGNVDQLEADVSSVKTYAIGGIVLAFIALIAAGLAITRKK